MKRTAVALPEATLSEHDGVRYLHLGTPWVQGAMRLAEPAYIDLLYIQRMLAALLWLPPPWGAMQAVQLGLGAGAITRFTLQQLRMATTVVELNPAVVQACHAWFRLPRQHAKLNVEIADAGAWLARTPLRDRVHLLHVDLYDQEAAAPVLDDADFYAACRAVLADDGVMAVNLFGRDASFATSIDRITAAFGGSPVATLQPTREGNTIAIAGCTALARGDVLAARAATIETRFGHLGLAARTWLRMIRWHR